MVVQRFIMTNSLYIELKRLMKNINAKILTF